MEDIITTLNEHWPIFTAFASAIAAAVTWIVSQQFANKEQSDNIRNLSDGCDKFNARICGLEASKVEFEKYQIFAKSNRERIEALEKSDKERGVTLATINTRLASIETDCKWLRRTLTNGDSRQNN